VYCTIPDGQKLTRSLRASSVDVLVEAVIVRVSADETVNEEEAAVFEVMLLEMIVQSFMRSALQTSQPVPQYTDWTSFLEIILVMVDATFSLVAVSCLTTFFQW